MYIGRRMRGECMIATAWLPQSKVSQWPSQVQRSSVSSSILEPDIQLLKSLLVLVHWTFVCSWAVANFSSLPLQLSAILWKRKHLPWLMEAGSSYPLPVDFQVTFSKNKSVDAVVAGQKWGPCASRWLAKWWWSCKDLTLLKPWILVRERKPNMCHSAGQISS